MTQNEQARLQVLNGLLAEHMTLDQAATLMGVSTRHARRITTAYREEGAAALAHGHRGRRPVNATPAAVIADVVRLASTRYHGANITDLSELLAEREGIHIGRTTLRRILLDVGLSSPRRRRPPKHRVRRQRMPRAGMLIQLDGSYHRWLGDVRPPFTLLLAVDDALFCKQEDSHNYFLLMQNLLRRRGIPLALYTDRHAVFKHTPGSGSTGTPTQFGRAMEELGIQMIFALSPQAKGRVERAAGTFQDRLITELRLAGATTMEQAKAVLKQFLPRYNRRFQVPAPCPDPAFRPLPPDLRLGQVLCFKHKRRVASDNTVKFQRHTLQLLPDRHRRSYAGQAVVVLHGLDGRLSLQHEGRIIAAQEARPSPGSLRNGIKPSSGDAIQSPDPKGLSEPRETAPDPLTMVAAENGHGSVIDDAAVVSMTMTTSPRRPTFLQQARWDAVQKAKLEGMSIRQMARELGLHRDTVRRYIDVETPPTRRSQATLPASTSDTIPQ